MTRVCNWGKQLPISGFTYLCSFFSHNRFLAFMNLGLLSCYMIVNLDSQDLEINIYLVFL